jgi:hypothetical protein
MAVKLTEVGSVEHHVTPLWSLVTVALMTCIAGQIFGVVELELDVAEFSEGVGVALVDCVFAVDVVVVDDDVD